MNPLVAAVKRDHVRARPAARAKAYCQASASVYSSPTSALVTKGVTPGAVGLAPAEKRRRAIEQVAIIGRALIK